MFSGGGLVDNVELNRVCRENKREETGIREGFSLGSVGDDELI